MRGENGFNPAVVDGETKVFDETALRSELQFTFSRSGGPGGQGVNTSDTKAQLRWNIDASRVFSLDEKDKIKIKLAGLINKKGELVLACQVTRSQRQNREMVLDKFLSDLEDALRPIIPRIPTKKPRGIKAREKRESEIKATKKSARGWRYRGEE